MDWKNLLMGFAAGLAVDKVVEYGYVASGLYESLGRKSWDDLALNYAGIGLAYYKKDLGLGFLAGVNTGMLLSFFDIWLGRVLPVPTPPATKQASTLRKVSNEHLTPAPQIRKPRFH
jgi:hypothetical protein